MKLGVLFSGGKDSCYALYKASKEHEIACLLSVFSENPESYMFHTPNIKSVSLQSQAMQIPLLTRTTKGMKEEELEDLKALITEAKDKFNIQGIVTGALASVYQSSRIKKICDELGLKCINPLWGMSQIDLLNDLLKEKFSVVITAVAAPPLGRSLLGKQIDNDMIEELTEYANKYKINPAGEGGEIETFVTSAPMFSKNIVIKKSRIEFSESDQSGVFIIEEAELQ
ncbi:MAG: diphthine--ammonia ligase [Candidatus Aenigmatarchaeota archaeon]